MNGTLAMDGNRNLFGTTQQGGANGYGTVFELVYNSGTGTYGSPVTLASFDSTTPGWSIYAGLAVDASGNLFGTTYSGGDNSDGTVFEVAVGSGTITKLASFNGANGAHPYSGVIIDGSGNLFGTTSSGGARGSGTVFEMAAADLNTIITLASFGSSGGAGGLSTAGLVMDGSGNLFGTTGSGGDNGFGTVFELSAADRSTIKPLYSFDYTNSGDGVLGSLFLDSSGHLIGATQGGGPGNGGTVFSVGTQVTPLKIGPLTLNGGTITADLNFAPTYPTGVVIDAMAPTVISVTRTDSDHPAGGSTVHFTVTFSEDLTAVPAYYDFFLTHPGTTGTINHTVTQVDAHTYIVAVDNVSGTGTLRLNVSSSGDITDLAGNQMNAFFNSGDVYTLP